jgi:hypothetical protein
MTKKRKKSERFLAEKRRNVFISFCYDDIVGYVEAGVVPMICSSYSRQKKESQLICLLWRGFFLFYDIVRQNF